jgi:hypothetical protein
MKRISTLFLQAVVVLFGVGVLAFLLGEPHVEGVNANATTFREIYLDDPFLAYVYLGSIAFFVALYQAFKLLGYIGRNEAFSPLGVKALGTIKKCALVLIAFLLGAEAYVMIISRTVEEDIAGGVMMVLIALLISAAVAALAAVFEKLLRSAAAIQSENDLTV